MTSHLPQIYATAFILDLEALL